MMTETRVLIAAPSEEVVSLAAVKTQLGITVDTSDDLLVAMISAVAARLDPATGGWLGRALRPQTWELRFRQFPYDSFTYGAIRLPYPPVTEVTSIKYDDNSGVEQTLVEGTDYRVFDLGHAWQTTVAPLYNSIWPIARYDRESVRIRYVAGYATADPDPLPPGIKSAIALGVQHLRSLGEQNLFLSMEEIPGVRQRRWNFDSTASAVVEAAILGLVAGLRVYG